MKTQVECRVVLVKPLYQWNIGSTSRAMSNMGFEQLILIAPRTEIAYPAQQAAATGQNALQNRKTYSSWEEFFANEPESLRLGFSARNGALRPLWNTRSVLRSLRQEHPVFQKNGSRVVHLIFGTEDSGLSAEDCEHLHFNLLLPVFGENVSLNLSQAVLLALFILREEWEGLLPAPAPASSRKNAFTFQPTAPDHVRLEFALSRWLTAMGLQDGERRVSAHKVLKRLLLHHVPTTKELRILEIVLQQSYRKLMELKSISHSAIFRDPQK